MKRQVVHIDEALCDGCALCIPNCHEGALQMIDGKARLISDLFCDGLGACLGHCPQGAISIEEREAEAYDERKVMQLMLSKGNNTVVAHLQHLLDHGENDFFEQGVSVLMENSFILELNGKHPELQSKLAVHGLAKSVTAAATATAATAPEAAFCGCQGSTPIDLSAARRSSPLPLPLPLPVPPTVSGQPSELQNWPIQMHLINPGAGYFRGADLLVAADCTAFSLGAFHSQMLRDKTLVIACPKLDDGKDRYIHKFVGLIDDARVNTITVAMMEVPCCSGLLQLIQIAMSKAGRKVPVKKIIIGVKGEILEEEWV